MGGFGGGKNIMLRNTNGVSVRRATSRKECGGVGGVMGFTVCVWVERNCKGNWVCVGEGGEGIKRKKEGRKVCNSHQGGGGYWWVRERCTVGWDGVGRVCAERERGGEGERWKWWGGGIVCSDILLLGNGVCTFVGLGYHCNLYPSTNGSNLLSYSTPNNSMAILGGRTYVVGEIWVMLWAAA